MRHPLRSPPHITNKAQIQSKTRLLPQKHKSCNVAHSHRPSHRAKRKPQSRSAGAGENSPKSKSFVQYQVLRSSRTGGLDRGSAAIEASNTIDAKHVNQRDHFRSPSLNPGTKHPAFRPPSLQPPPLPPRPGDCPQSPRTEGSTKPQRAFNQSPSSTSASSTTSSPCGSITSTEAATVVPEEMVPPNLIQERLRQLKSVGFAEERHVQYPMFGRMKSLKTREVGSQAPSFRMSKQDQGYISPRVNSICRQGS